MNTLQHAAELIAGAQRLVVFTGAGMSAESGVPTFRDALTGLWARYDAQALATPEAFQRDPALVWGWYEWRRELVERVDPNPGHEAVARLDCTLITQNVDQLHERAGSEDVLHLHGSLFEPRCSVCAQPAPPPPGAAGSGDGPRTPPACGNCGSPVRPGVVWFGEALPVDVLERAVEAAAAADVLITVGTAGVVYPAAEIPQVTARLGGSVIQVNPQATPLDEVCALNLRGTAAEVLPKIIR
ncbi:NAD-dependent protein deacylase 1 [Paractinoplanes abujensis]|uniref:NAD-dependent protein deacylase n=1 Tax=Paractinoplanes abujensis TaxID=882441 RepID=A0A7W7D0F6_9ACTN|nr:NAD-dependent deacylase [Actinoplanes abujensis]MBB4698027.1 NAD-dependent deacetylase [Actinoplanes abujensis]GID19489.1 NAD-dependent protein deacylase 1 [Actinoplanes abujensis]